MRLPRETREALDATGLPWSVEQGGIHYKIRLCGRLVAILPKGRVDERGRGQKNIVAQIRRAARDRTHGA